MAFIDWAIIALYFSAILFIGWRDRRSFGENATDVILGGRFLTLPAFVATLVTTWYGGILGVGEYTYNFGISNWLVFGAPYYVGALAFALFFAKRARQSEALTIPQRLRERIGPRSGAIAALLVFVTTAPTAYVLMLGALAHFLLGVDIVTGSIIGALFSLVYVFFGGFRSVVRTDMIQFVLMFGGFAALFAVLVMEHGFTDFLFSKLPETHMTWDGGAGGWYMASWYVIALGALVEPAFHQRCYAAKSIGTARKGVIISVLFWMGFDFLTTSCGLYARVLLPNLADPSIAFPALGSAVLPPFALGLFMCALLAIVMSTIDSYSFIAATTFSFDFIQPLKRFANKPSFNIHRYTLIGLALSSAIALSLSLAFESIVTVWREFGSVLMPALLAPLVYAFWRNKEVQALGDRQGVWLMILPGVVSLSWILYRHLGPTGEYPFSDEPFLAEPIFPGLYVSVALVIIFELSKKMKASERV